MNIKVEKKSRVVLYHRPGCHLCEEAESVIRNALLSIEFEFEMVDIEGDLELLDLHRYDIPVVEINGEIAFRHRIELKQLIRILGSV